MKRQLYVLAPGCRNSMSVSHERSIFMQCFGITDMGSK